MATLGEPVHQTFVCKKFTFEEIIYLYVWVILLAITVIGNVLTVYVYMQKSLRSLTSLLFVAIAISDSLTGLVTIPSYFLVYTSVEPPPYEYNANNQTLIYDYMYDVGDGNLTSSLWEANYELNTNDTTVEDNQAYFLDNILCDAFMISKYYLAKVFHTISIWHTLYLGIQRYISIRYHIKAKFLLTTRRKIIGSAVIIFLAPVLHLYHLLNNKKVDGFCAWEIEKDCSETCINLWVTLLFRHLLPCIVLTVITVLLVRRLVRNKQIVNARRVAENRRSSKNCCWSCYRVSYQRNTLWTLSFIQYNYPAFEFRGPQQL